MNRDDLNRLVKKEEATNDYDDNDVTEINYRERSTTTGANYCDDDYNYSDWKKGNWCWLLPANTNTNSNSNNNENENKNEDTTAGSDDETPIDPLPKKKLRDDGDRLLVNIDSIKQKESSTYDKDEEYTTTAAAVDHENGNDDDLNGNIAIKKKAKEEDDRDHKVNATVNDSNINSSSTSISSNDNNNDGYESWTEGNWCLLHSENVDNDDGRDVSSAAKSKTKRKSTMRYSTLQNKKWDDMFQQLVAYKKEHKSTIVPISYEADPKLGTWVSNQRQFYKHRRTITDHRVRRLDCIGFVWEINETVPWEEMYQRLVAYRNQHNSTNVSHRYQVDPKLGKWVSTQRRKYKYNDHVLSVQQIKLLESIGFVWDRFDAQWMEMYSRLVAYKNKYNSTNVHQHFKADSSHLGSWVSIQRQCYRKKNLVEKRMKLLNSIDFLWSVNRVPKR